MTGGADAQCRALMSGISAYLDGDLDATECSAIEHHCRSCARCAAVVEGLRQTIGLCREAGVTPLPEAVSARARDRVRRLLEAGQATDSD